jgi:DNA-nicking Smr family endonuclease
MGGRRALTDADRADWERFATPIRPLPDKPARPVSPPPADSAAPGVRRAPGPAAASLAPRLAIADQPPGLDSATWQRFRTGKLPIARTLDLHGMTVQRAFHAMSAFLRTAHAEGLRCVEVVTGRGSAEGGGAIRREFPFWLNQPEIRPLVLAAVHPHPANPGSVRLLLRRTR